MTRDLDLAYLAGVVDADGYVTATRSVRRQGSYFGAQVGITGSRREPHDLAATTFGGNVSIHRPAAGRPQFHWQLNGSRTVAVIRALRPFLRIKRAQADLAIELQEWLDHATAARREAGDPYPHMPAGYDPTASLNEMVDEIRSLHARTQAHLRLEPP